MMSVSFIAETSVLVTDSANVLITDSGNVLEDSQDMVESSDEEDQVFGKLVKASQYTNSNEGLSTRVHPSTTVSDISNLISS